MGMHRLLQLVTVFLTLMAAGAAAITLQDQALLRADSDPDNWRLHGRTYDNQRFSPLAGHRHVVWRSPTEKSSPPYSTATWWRWMPRPASWSGRPIRPRPIPNPSITTPTPWRRRSMTAW